MTSENLDLISDMLARAQRDPSALRAILADDVEWDAGLLHVLGDSAGYQGAEGVMEFFRTWVGAFSEWGYAVGEVFAVGDDHVVAEIHQWGIGRSSGARVDQSFWQVWTLRDGKAVRGTNHETREEALATTAA